MKPITEQEVVDAGNLSAKIFEKYNITHEDQDLLYNALATIGVWKIVQHNK